MLAKQIGGILLIVGTSVGAGMLALPIANASVGFWPSSGLLVLCWLIMTLGAFFILEVNLYLPPGKNMLSMAYETLGKSGLLMTWGVYLLLLYALLSAYISGGADMMSALLALLGIQLKSWHATCIFTIVFGCIVYSGIRRVDLLNRSLMLAKLLVYGLLVILISPFIEPIHFTHASTNGITSAVMILITSFGFAIIIPSLRTYFDDDIKVLKKVVLIGSLIPLLCYLAWDAVIMGSIPPHGNASLASLMEDQHATSMLAKYISGIVHNSLISSLFNFFTSICMLTAFLGVSLCLMNFLSDGLNLSENGVRGLGLFIATFLPPTLIVIYYPGAYIHALEYAGALCVILLLLLPAAMTLFGRRRFKSGFTVPFGNITPIFLLITSIGLLIMTVLH